MKPGDHPEFFRFPAPAGQSRESTIRLDREGRFWHDGALVEHPRLAEAMHGWIARHPDDGRYILTNGYDWTYFMVDDAPFSVRAVSIDEPAARAEGAGGAPRATLRLSSGADCPLEPGTLQLGDEGALYTTVYVNGQPFEARFTRFAQGQLGPLLVEGEGGVGVQDGDRVVYPGQRQPAPLTPPLTTPLATPLAPPSMPVEGPR
jgi:uncharacterized protein